MKTQEQIVEYIKAHSEAFDFTPGALVPYLDYEHALPYLKPETTREQWEAERVKNADDATVKAELADYMAFAWGKVEDHRGISASRSVDKCSAWAWLLAGDDILKEIEATDYAQYGAPKLAVICHRFGLPIPSSEDVQRMIRGERCGATYDCGCGS